MLVVSPASCKALTGEWADLDIIIIGLIKREENTEVIIHLQEFFSEISVEPPIEDWVADTGAEGQGMTQSQSEEIQLGENVTFCQLTN